MECFNIDNYLEKLILRCKETFGGRLVYVGLQGSWLRGEATENRDIDVMIVLLMALSRKKSESVCSAMSNARVVLPTPGGPQNIIDWILWLSMAVRNTAPLPIRCS